MRFVLDGLSDTRDILCLSHLRWSFVWQRPQQLLSRFARHRRVFFVEEPLFRDSVGDGNDSARWEVEDQDGVIVCRPVCRDPGPGGGPILDAMYEAMVPELVRRHRIRNFVLWVYTPMLLPAATRLNPSLVVYDCMDELSLFKGAPSELVARERQLLASADLVFTGGISLYRAKSRWHPSTHCFPSGVDVAHYGRALLPETTVPEDLVTLPGPRVGFFGVIDERTDLDLLGNVARLQPEWSFVMIGPVVKIDAGDLPQAPNLHYMGQRPYAQLPSYLRGFDVAMMPFARNHATRFISPTKTLEYMAAHKPIVTTPINDVVEFYRDLVWIADTPEAFAAAVEAAVNESAEARSRRIQREKATLARNCWDSIARRMEQLMAKSARAPVVGPTYRQAVLPATAAPASTSALAGSALGAAGEM